MDRVSTVGSFRSSTKKVRAKSGSEDACGEERVLACDVRWPAAVVVMARSSTEEVRRPWPWKRSIRGPTPASTNGGWRSYE